MGEEAGLQELLDQDPAGTSRRAATTSPLLHLLLRTRGDRRQPDARCRRERHHPGRTLRPCMPPRRRPGSPPPSSLRKLAPTPWPALAVYPAHVGRGGGNQAMANSLLRAGATAGPCRRTHGASTWPSRLGHKQLVAFPSSAQLGAKWLGRAPDCGKHPSLAQQLGRRP
jgi:hypothetical protein